MARYDREFLVPYLEDICALQLSKRKIKNMIASSEEEISEINQAALNSVEAPKLEAYEGEASTKGLGTGCLGCILGIAAVVSFFVALFSGEQGMLVLPLILAISGIWLTIQFMGAKDEANQQIKARNDERERDHALEQAAALMAVEPKNNAVYERIETLKQEADKVDALLEKAYSANVIPRWYRDLYPAIYLYDWFSNSRADDLDIALNTLVLEQIKDKLDIIIRNQGESIINQRIMIANQKKSMEQAERHHAEQMMKLDSICASNEERNMYLSMIEANTAASAYFLAAHYLR